MQSSRNNSGSVQSSSRTPKEAPVGKKVGGGGVIAKRPPPRPNRNPEGQSQASKQGLAIDTASSKESRQQPSAAGSVDQVTPRRQQSGIRS